MKSVEGRIANLSIVCACIVALSHVCYNADTGSVGWWFVRMTRFGICCFAVPFFFMVSGYFLSRRFEEKGWWVREMTKRIASLIVPYLIWCFAFFIFACVGAAVMKTIAGQEFWSVLRFPLSKMTKVFGMNLAHTPMLVPTWYIRALFTIMLVSPVIAYVVKFKCGVVLLTLGVFCAYVLLYPHRNGLKTTEIDHFFYYGVSVFGLLYFLLGVLMRKTRFLEKTLDCAPWTGIVCIALGVSLVVFRVKSIAVTGWEPFPVLCLAIPFLLVGIWLLMPSKRWPEWIVSMSFPIYVIHYFVVFAMDGFHKVKTDKSICVMLFQFVCAVVIPCLVSLLLRKGAPRFALILFGGR